VPKPRVTLTAVPHSYLSNCPRRGPQACTPWGRGQCLGHISIPAISAQEKHLCLHGGQEHISLVLEGWSGFSTSFQPCCLSISPGQAVCVAFPEAVTGDPLRSLSPARLGSQAGIKPTQKKPKQHLRAFGKTQGVPVPFAQTQDWDNTIWGSEAQYISRIYME